jgi:hypothetical protein
MQAFWISLLLAVSAFAVAQSSDPAHTPWQMQESGTAANLRGIDSVDGTVAWASGTGGTVLKTIDGGAHWTKCAVPDAAADGAMLDFRGVQAFGAKAAFVMSSGKGKLSRLYKTTDGCRTWKLIFTNPDKDGFWDALLLNRFDRDGEILGDPVDGEFVFFETEDQGITWKPEHLHGLKAKPYETAFAASNSAMFLDERYGTGFVTGARVFFSEDTSDNGKFTARPLPISLGSMSGGSFSIDTRDWCCRVAVGGNYLKPNESIGTAVYTRDGGVHWLSATTPPHGYRSAVQWGDALKAWITVGTNGSDISRDHGKTWQPVDDGKWNALSLPFVVGPSGRIARINPAALPHSMP